jgi:hypothetical protein
MLAARRRSLLGFLSLCAAVALWIDLSPIHLGQTSDSLIPVFVSLQHWTPFYWEQSRFGMLVPLLAMPFEQPLANLLVQNGLTIFAGLAAIGLMARFFIRSRAWFGAACGSCAVFLVCLAEPLRCDYLIAQPYGVSFGLGYGALLLLDRAGSRWRWCLAMGLILLAGWVNLAVGPALLLMVLARWAGQGLRRRRVPLRLMLLLVLGTCAGATFEWLAEFRDAHVTRLAPLGQWLPACHRLVANVVEQGGVRYCATLLLLVAIAVPCVLLAPRRRTRVAVSAAISLLSAAFLLLLLAGSNRWTARNDFMPRYIYVAILAAQTALVATIVIALPGERRGVSPTWTFRRPRRAYASTLAVLLAIVFSYGIPSFDATRASLERRLGAETDAVLRDGYTHIAGDYWRVWPAVFHANWKLYDQGETRTVWGVAYRSLPTERHWAPLGPNRSYLLMLGHDPRAEFLLRRHFSFAFAAKDRKLPKSREEPNVGIE